MLSYEILESMTKIQNVKPVFTYQRNWSWCPILGDAPNIKSAEFPTIKSIDGTHEEWHEKYDQSSNAQRMMKGEYDGQFTHNIVNRGHFTHISIPFSSSLPLKGAYICIVKDLLTSLPSQLIFTLTSSKGEKTSKKYEFPKFYDAGWYFLPVDLPDVVLCEITGKGRWRESFEIHSLVFISREETPEELKSREAREKLWSEAPVVKAEFVKEGWRDSIPIPRDDPKLVDPSFSMVKCKDDSVSKESEYYDQSSDAQKMLKGEDSVELSHLSIPFPSPSPMKGAYICVDDFNSSPSLLFTFTDCDGKKISKKYEFARPKHFYVFTGPEHWYEWHFLPIDLDNVVLCEIEGKGTRWWCFGKNSRSFDINSLVFLRGDDIPTSPPLLPPVRRFPPISSTPSSSSPIIRLSIQQTTSLIQQGNVVEIEKMLKSKQLLPSWRSLDNHTALHVALLSHQYKVFALLKSYGHKRLRSERKDMPIEYFQERQCEKIREAVIHRAERIKGYIGTMWEIYSALNSIPMINIIIQVIKACPSFVLIIDFEDHDIREISAWPGKATDFTACGRYLRSPENRVIRSPDCLYIAGKRENPLDIHATIAHELTHLALYYVFRNGCRPFYVSQDPRIFDEVILEAKSGCEQTYYPMDMIIRRVFSCYEKEEWSKELIVRVPEILARYGEAKGIEILQYQAPKLLEWYKTKVIPECESFIKSTDNYH
ncbi:hypothetical protein ADUPG1_013563 [Aduncisulcus paluster]|uniref:Uncharacterized protein n=1 Tax=Aduncisulcus paluster TaxID=2918883 RepID=A0ABQ5K576_9EUKA|nr:hypothetical protein ADUPG1_013563 [Aduncisulcus paluster]